MRVKGNNVDRGTREGAGRHDSYSNRDRKAQSESPVLPLSLPVPFQQHLEQSQQRNQQQQQQHHKKQGQEDVTFGLRSVGPLPAPSAALPRLPLEAPRSHTAEGPY